MKSGRKLLSAFLAFLLAFCLTPLPAFAEPTADQAGVDQSTVTQSADQAGDGQTAEVPAATQATDQATDQAAVHEAPGRLATASAENADVAAVSFVYIESETLPTGAAQNIVIGFADDSLKVADAALLVVRGDGERVALGLDEAVEGAALFSVSENGLALGSYDIASLTFVDATGTTWRVDFTADDVAEYRFEVVEAPAADQAAAADGEGVTTTAYTVNDEGELVEAGDIASAMAIAGVDPLSGPESSAGADVGEGVLVTQADHDGFVVVIDPGHGGRDGGATSYVVEKEVNLKISQYCKAALEKVPGVTVYMTRTDDTYLSLTERVNFAIDHNADLLLCLHNNAGGGSGSEVIVPRNGSWYFEETYLTGQELGAKILSKLNALGLGTHAGVYSRDNTLGAVYPDGTLADYFTIISGSREAGLLGLIVEHAFVDNASDAAWLTSEENLKRLGEADAQAVIEYYDSSEGIDRLYWGVFDFDYYTSHYADVKAQYGSSKLQTFGYFKSTGMSEGHRGNALFDVAYYKAKYEDLQNAFGNDLTKYYQHFLEYGMSEGRQPSAEFNPVYYKANYSDLRAAFGSDWTSYYKHYLEYGISEGRTANELLPDAILDSDVVAMYRLYNPNSGEHFYTSSDPECDHLIDVGWRYEGIGWTAPKTSSTPVYRLYNRYGGEHHYTTSAAERDSLKAAGWSDEGVGWYSDDAKAKPLYRQYNPNAFANNHNYTTSTEEKANLLSLGWRDEGIGWYGLNYDSETVEKAASTDEAVMGASQTSVAQMVRRYNAVGKPYPSGVYGKYGASNIEQFCQILYEEANAEGVRAEVVFAQAMHETGWLQYGGDVNAEQCNFAGIGATGGVPGNSFNTYGSDSVRMGLRAQVQHLKAYASTEALKNSVVDPRFTLVTRGSATTVQALAGKWATGGEYGNALVSQIRLLLQA